jgi:hypothetical protein
MNGPFAPSLSISAARGANAIFRFHPIDFFDTRPRGAFHFPGSGHLTGEPELPGLIAAGMKLLFELQKLRKVRVRRR